MDVFGRNMSKLAQVTSCMAMQRSSCLHTSAINHWRNPRNQRSFFRRERPHSEQFPSEFTSFETRINSVKESVLPSEFADYRFKYQEFLPMTDLNYRQPLKDKIERLEMLKRRKIIEIPEFYVGSKLAVTISDPNAPGKVSKFVGICIAREGQGLRATFTLRNAIDHEGVEIRYDLYNPTIRSIEVLKLEKRLDDHLYYLRDAPLHYSEVPFDMEPEILPDNTPVPINEAKVKMNPYPWSINWQSHYHYLKGIEGMDQVPEDKFLKAQKHINKDEKFDLMKRYRENIPEEDQFPIWRDIKEHTQEVEEKRKEERRRRYLKKTYPQL